MEKIILTNCTNYKESVAVCYGDGEPKGQCDNCGYKWFEHDLIYLKGDDFRSAKQIQRERGVDIKDLTIV